MKPKISLDRLLLERTSLAGIVRVTGISERWLQSYVNQKYEQIAQQIDVKAVWPLSAMNYALMLENAIINNGFGLRLTVTQERL